MKDITHIKIWSKRQRGITPKYLLDHQDTAAVVDRTTVFGNPFVVDKHGTRQQCIDWYEQWIHLPKQEHLRSRMRSELRDKHLICWCAPEPCHATIIRYIANAPWDWVAEQEYAIMTLDKEVVARADDHLKKILTNHHSFDTECIRREGLESSWDTYIAKSWGEVL